MWLQKKSSWPAVQPWGAWLWSSWRAVLQQAADPCSPGASSLNSGMQELPCKSLWTWGEVQSLPSLQPQSSYTSAVRSLGDQNNISQWISSCGKGQEPPDKLPCLKNTDCAKEPPALLKGTVMCSLAWWLFQQAVKGNHPWTDNSWQQRPRRTGTTTWHHPTILIHVCWVLGVTGEPSWLSMSSRTPSPPQLTDGFMGSSSCQFIKRRLMPSGNCSWSDGLELPCDVPSPCCTYPCAQCRLLSSNSLSAEQKAPAQLFVTQLNPPRGLFNETSMHEAVAHPSQSGCMTMLSSDSVHLELFILGKGWSSWAGSWAAGKG